MNMIRKRKEPWVSQIKALRLTDCLAKSYAETEDKILPGVNVETHGKIVGLIAEALIARMPIRLRGHLFPEGTNLVAAVHDIGKINPHFQEKLYRNLMGYQKNSLPGLEYARPELEQSYGWHSAVSQAALQGTAKYVPEIAGWHHGDCPNHILQPEDEVIGGKAWQSVRMEFLSHMKRFFQRDWPEIREDLHAGVIAGLTTVADWIGSAAMFDTSSHLKESELELLAEKAINQAGFVFPKVRPGLQFEDVFPPFSPHPIQQEFIEQVDSPGVYILEALMGAGKTEAALQAAYHLIESNQTAGIYFALPTRLTSEKIYDRMNNFLETILDSEDAHRSLLLHSNAWLHETDMGEDARPGYSWFHAKKRRLLAPFGVGTIDQALLAVMHVKHGFVRAFGLLGKVVILDEVHTYDAYTGTIMDHLIKCLRFMGCTVILLSATLTGKRKLNILQAGGAGLTESTSKQYPLITKTTANAPVSVSSVAASHGRKVAIMQCNSRQEAMNTVCEKALAGEYILWIENTVSDAQDCYKVLSAWGKSFGIETGLLHARFPEVVREQLDAYWVDVFGKAGISLRSRAGKILIGTQVLEQSLDIDADFLVTQIAPTDMILQRIGRLWRHREADQLRPRKATCEAMILSPPDHEIRQKPKSCFGATGYVYAPYVLVRSHEVWNQKEQITIPDDMRELIERTYDSREEEGQLLDLYHELEQEREAKQRFAFNSISAIGKPASDNISTRYLDIPTNDVLLLLKDPDIESRKIHFVDGEVLCIPENLETNLRKYKEIAVKVMKHLLSVSRHIAPKPVSKHQLNWLKPFLYVSEDAEERIRVAVLQPSGQIRGIWGNTVHDTHELSYTHMLGYCAHKMR